MHNVLDRALVKHLQMAADSMQSLGEQYRYMQRCAYMSCLAVLQTAHSLRYRTIFAALFVVFMDVCSHSSIYRKRWEALR